MYSFGSRFLSADLGRRPSRCDTAAKNSGGKHTFPRGTCCAAGRVWDETELKTGISKAYRKGLRGASTEGRLRSSKSAAAPPSQAGSQGSGCGFSPTRLQRLRVGSAMSAVLGVFIARKLENTPHRGFKT